ncbi:MAG: 50S ribosomal protein L25 [Candidatus Humimicrobiaceae bacterium]
MENLLIEIAKRSAEEHKNNASGRLRKNGFIPGVLYGLKSEPLSIKVDLKDFKDLIKGKGISGHIFDLKLTEEGKSKKIAALIKDFQIEPLSREYSHIDFMRIEMKHEVTISIPILVLNEEKAFGIKEEGGVLQHGIREVEISCLPKDIPANISIDVTELKIGEIVKIADINVPENVKILSDPEETILTIIHASHLKVEEEAVVETAEPEPEVIKKEKTEAKAEEK